MKKIDLFPLSVFCLPLGFPPPSDKSTDARTTWIDRILQMRQASAPPRSAISAWTGDIQEHAFLHEEPLFNPLFTMIGRGLSAYINEMGVDTQQLDLYITRSWGVVAEKNERINRHAHLQSHLSVAYYLQKPPDGGRIAFLMTEAPNEFLPGLFESKMASLFKGPRSGGNSSTTLVDVEEGDLVIFPSKTVHATEPHNSDIPRVSISADIIVTLKDSKNHEFGLPSLSHWKKMNP
jgi:uncharacterized protein (TIGR02466 family)